MRAGLVRSLEELDNYQWFGHSVIMMKQQAQEWQDREYVLKLFGTTEGKAGKAYRTFVSEQNVRGKQLELTGGGFIRSMGGWSALKGKRSLGEKELWGMQGFWGAAHLCRRCLIKRTRQSNIRYKRHGREKQQTII